ncbi:34243_t:CDS:10 [Gigaspora margarita]|uniref:34243_t:CDS:1 n=1 Tax=Gigaspora margarita TaxID=4874 RepID=A0ABN7WC03_GIGMA|nr:34243_t:CDS:10 [Gigaspora margarita]
MSSDLYSIPNASTDSLRISRRPRNSIELTDDDIEFTDDDTENLNLGNSVPITDDIRMVVSIDFGTTFSGFAYAHIYDNDDTNFDYNTYEKWPISKTNTALLYDKEFNNVLEWGEEALKRVNDSTSRPVELFKLGLSKLELGLNKLEIGSSKLVKNLKLNLPTQLHPVEEQRYKRAITDYLKEMGMFSNLFANNYKKNHILIEEVISEHWPGITLKNVRWILTIPVVYSYRAKQIMRGTVDLTMRKLLSNCEVALSEVTECTGDFCGSVFIDQEFLKFLGEIVGHEAIELLCEKNYGQMQYMIRVFCQEVKIKYTGEENFSYEFELGRTCQALKNHVTGEIKRLLDKKDWIIKICGNDVKKMFDPVIEKIIQLVRIQLKNSRNTCSAIFMVGGFSASRYLQERIKKEFKNDVKYILTPPKPVAAIVSGAVVYGLRNNAECDAKVPLSRPIILDRVLKYSYGVEHENSQKFYILAKRGTRAKIDQKFEFTSIPVVPNQSSMFFKLHISQNDEPKNCNEEGVQLLGELEIDLPDVSLGCDRQVKFSICFAEEEIKVFAVNLQNGQNYHATFNLDPES